MMSFDDGSPRTAARSAKVDAAKRRARVEPSATPVGRLSSAGLVTFVIIVAHISRWITS